MMSPEIEAAFLCQSRAKQGEAHQWDYNGDRKTYRCRNCLVTISKAELKELTDNA